MSGFGCRYRRPNASNQPSPLPASKQTLEHPTPKLASEQPWCADQKQKTDLRAETGQEVVRIAHYPSPVLRHVASHVFARPRHDISAECSRNVTAGGRQRRGPQNGFYGAAWGGGTEDRNGCKRGVVV